MPVSPQDFDYIRNLAKDLTAIVLDPGKEYLVESRLMPLCKKHGFNTIEDFVQSIRQGNLTRALEQEIIDTLTTNETSFYRDLPVFEYFEQEVMPYFIEKNKDTRKLSIWSAACSSGQEPYSLAMQIRERFPQINDWDVTIYASDLSTKILHNAREGRYNQFEVNRGLPGIYLIKYFRKDDNTWIVKDEVRNMIEFAQINLVKKWPPMPTFDVIFIRNVMIYFDQETKREIYRNLHRCLNKDGYLFLGGSESVLNVSEEFVSCTKGNSAIYRKKETEGAVKV